MNKSVREHIDFISKPAMIKQMRTFLSDTSTERMKALHYYIVMVRNQHEDTYYVRSYDVSVHHYLTVGAFYRHRYHRYFKHGHPRKLRKAR